MQDRKGITTIILWTFIMIAGGLIILFFFMLANAQAESGQQELALMALQQVDSILTTQQGASDTYAMVPIPEAKIVLRCAYRDTFTVSELDIAGYSRSLEYDLVVGRDMQTANLQLFSKELALPFDIGNVLFVSNPQEAVVFYYDEDTYKQTMPQLLRMFPKEMTDDTSIDRQVFSNTPVSGAGIQNLRIVKVGEENPPTIAQAESAFTIPGVKPNDASYIYVQSSSLLQQGTVTFYKRSEKITGSIEWTKGETYSYVGPTHLLALIWQGDDNKAACLQTKIAKKLFQQADLHATRMDLLYTKAQSEDNVACASKYNSLLLRKLQTTPPLLNDLYAKVAAVAGQNEGMLRGVRCATIY